MAIGEATDALNLQGDAYCDLAEVLAAAGRTDEAAQTLEQALERYERKKNLAMVAQVRAEAGGAAQEAADLGRPWKAHKGRERGSDGEALAAQPV